MTAPTLPPALAPARKPIVGMVHLLPLPGSPRWSGSMSDVLDRAQADARALAEGGVDALLVENYGDVPFHADRVEPWTVAAVTAAVARVRETAPDLPVGVNVLRNDALAALAVATATGAAFIRINVHTGAMFTDQGVIAGSAARTLRARRALEAGVAIVADVHVKHAVPPPGSTLAEAARDAVERGLADVVVVSGARTGEATPAGDIREVRRSVPGAPVWIGSGVTPETAPELLRLADGAIVGSSLHRDGVAGRGVERARVQQLVDAAAGT